MKKIIKTLFILLISFSFVGLVDAATKEVLVEGTNIIGTDGKNGATWNDATSTLTLNNYSGKKISIDGFGEENINVILKGTNTIDGTGDSYSFAGIYSPGNVNITVTGETGSILNIKNYSGGIETYGGALTVKNAVIVADGLSKVFYSEKEILVDNLKLTSTDVYTSFNASYVKITIKNSNITMTGGNDDIYTDSTGEVLIQNSIITSTNNSDRFTYTENLTIEDSTIKFDAPYGLYNYGDIVISNSDITAENNYNYAVDCDGDFTMNDSTFSITDAYYGLNIDGILNVKNSDINVTDAYYAMLVSNTDANDTNFNIKNSVYGLMSSGNTEINGGSITIISDDEDATDATGIDAGDLVFNTKVVIDLKYTEYYAIIANTLVINGGTIQISVPNGTGVSLYGLEMNGGEMHINCRLMGLLLLPGVMYMNAGSLYVEVSEFGAIFAGSVTDAPYENIIKLADHTILESNLKKVKTKGLVPTGSEPVEGWGYSFATNDLEEYYDSVYDVFPIVAKKVSIVGNKRIVFDANGGTGTMDALYQTGKVTLPTNGFTAPSGKKFKGWSLTPNGELITEVDVDKLVTVYAVWEDEEVPNTIDSIEYYIVGTFTLLSTLFVSLSLKKKYN